MAASERDIGKLNEGGWMPPLTWRHHLLAAGALCELPRPVGEVVEPTK
ncbi:hypothetical protein [Aquincola agrisoli]